MQIYPQIHICMYNLLYRYHSYKTVYQVQLRYCSRYKSSIDMSISMLILVVSPEPGVGGITGWWCASRGVLGTLSCRSMSSVVESWPSSDKSSLPCTLIGS